MKTYSEFTLLTAKDYDVSVGIVQKAYEKYGSTKFFYMELEKHQKAKQLNFFK